MGIAEFMAPRSVTRAAGFVGQPLLLRSIGLREIVTGAGILMQRQQAGWLWSRVAGDVVDIALLTRLGSHRGSRNQRLALTTAAIAGIAILDLLAAAEQTRLLQAERRKQAARVIHVKKSLFINRSPQECYRFWRDIENFPRFMQHVESVQQVDPTHSHWTVQATPDCHVHWTAELISDRPGQQLAWRTLDGAELGHTGTVDFAPLGDARGTRLDVDLHYLAPPGKAASMLERMFGEEPDEQIEADLRCFKQLIETGELATTVSEPGGKRSS
jgi:uncharacterized membrane protein